MPERPSMHWERSPTELTDRFAAVTGRHPEIARRKMFGEIAGFVNGNMVTGLHSSRWFVRLVGEEQAEALALPGAKRFEPMPGRPMGDYVVLPPEVLDDDSMLNAWLEKAIAVGKSLKPK
jgi:TfoX/Sxy family transcriptional regulator of competence genes